MKLDDIHTEKIDPLLRDALNQAQEDKVLLVAMVLDSESNDVENGDKSQKLDPSQFGSREVYRKALIDQRQTKISSDTGNTRRALTELSLKVRGGAISRIVVVEGTARQILAALELPGVRHASLDRPIELERPYRKSG